MSEGYVSVCLIFLPIHFQIVSICIFYFKYFWLVWIKCIICRNCDCDFVLWWMLFFFVCHLISHINWMELTKPNYIRMKIVRNEYERMRTVCWYSIYKMRGTNAVRMFFEQFGFSCSFLCSRFTIKIYCWIIQSLFCCGWCIERRITITFESFASGNRYRLENYCLF